MGLQSMGGWSLSTFFSITVLIPTHTGTLRIIPRSKLPCFGNHIPVRSCRYLRERYGGKLSSYTRSQK